MRLTSILAALALTATLATAQHPTFTASVGTPQSVPSPVLTGGPTGAANLTGVYCELPVPRLKFEFTCLPINWAHGAVTSENCYFVLDFAPSSLPGGAVLGGQFYLPMVAPIFIDGGPVRYIGPADVVCAGTRSNALSSGITCPIPGTSRQGALLDLSSGISAGLNGVPLTMQAFMLDLAGPTGPVAYTSNALNFIFLP